MYKNFNNDFAIGSKIRSPTELYNYYFNILLSRCSNMFKFTNLPKTVNENYFNISLMVNGQCSLTKVNDNWYGIYGMRGSEPNAYYLPTQYVIANPYLNISESKDITSNDITIFYNSAVDEICPTASGLFGLISNTAEQLASIDISIRKAIENSRVIAFLTAENENEKISAEKALKSMQEGDDIVAVKSLYDNIKLSPLSNDNISKNLQAFIETRQYIIANFYHNLGVNSNYNLKRAQISNEEIKTNDDVLIINTADMLNERKKCVEEFNKKSGLSLTVDFSEEWQTLKAEKSLDVQTQPNHKLKEVSKCI